jgi:hypothetical protein
MSKLLDSLTFVVKFIYYNTLFIYTSSYKKSILDKLSYVKTDNGNDYILLEENLYDIKKSKLEIRGDASRYYLKKQYEINKKYILNGFMVDPTLSKSYLFFYFAKLYSKKLVSPNMYNLYDLFIKDDYMGVYWLMDNKKKFTNKNTIKLTRLIYVKDQYKTQTYNQNKTDDIIYMVNNTAIIYDSETNPDYIGNTMSIFNNIDLNKLDVDSFIDYYIIQLISNNIDGFYKNLFLEYTDNKLKIQFIWDFDNTTSIFDTAFIDNWQKNLLYWLYNMFIEKTKLQIYEAANYDLKLDTSLNYGDILYIFKYLNSNQKFISMLKSKLLADKEIIYSNFNKLDQKLLELDIFNIIKHNNNKYYGTNNEKNIYELNMRWIYNRLDYIYLHIDELDYIYLHIDELDKLN